MKANLLWRLEKKMDDFINEIAEKELNEYEGYYHPELAEQMAEAAAQVFDASFMAQEYAEQEKGI